MLLFASSASRCSRDAERLNLSRIFSARYSRIRLVSCIRVIALRAGDPWLGTSLLVPSHASPDTNSPVYSTGLSRIPCYIPISPIQFGLLAFAAKFATLFLMVAFVFVSLPDLPVTVKVLGASGTFHLQWR